MTDAAFEPVSHPLLWIGNTVHIVVLPGSDNAFFYITGGNVKVGQAQTAQLRFSQTNPFAGYHILHDHVTLNAVRTMDLDQGRFLSYLPITHQSNKTCFNFLCHLSEVWVCPWYEQRLVQSGVMRGPTRTEICPKRMFGQHSSLQTDGVAAGNVHSHNP